MSFGPFLHLFGHFTTLRARISGKHYPKSKFLQNSNSPYQIYPESQKSSQKSSFGRFYIFLTVIFDSLTFGFRIIAQRFQIGLGRKGSHLIEHMLVHIRVTCVK
jgi:hypothetical protein